MEYREISRRNVALILMGIIILAGGLRLYGLDRQSLWYDEVIEERNFQVLINNILHVSKKTPDIAPPLNSFVIYMITQLFPNSDFALRIPSVIFGLTSVYLLFILGRRFFNTKVGLIASFMLAISPFHIWYSQDARMYALYWMFSLISLIYFIKALEEPKMLNFAGYLISTEACLFTHVFTVFLVLVQVLYILFLFREYKKQIFKWLSTFLLLMILYLPWIIYSLMFLMDKASAFYKPVDFKVFFYTIYSYCAGFSIGPSLRELHLDQSLTIIKTYLVEIVSLMTVYCTLFVLGVFYLQKNKQKLLFLFLLLIIPIIGIFAITIAKPDITYNVRYTSIAFFAFLLFVALGIERLIYFKPRIKGITFTVLSLIIITGFSLYSYTNYQYDKRYHKEDIRGAVSYIKGNVMPNDVVLCIVNHEAFNRYWGGNMCGGLSDTGNKEMIEAAVRKIAEGKSRLWLVLSREWYADRYGYAKAWLDENYKEIKQLHKGINDIANVNIYSYDLLKREDN